MAEITRQMKREAALRELKLRRRVYPRWVEQRRISQEIADREIAVMEAIAADYAEPDLFADENDMLHVAAIGRFEPGDVDPDGFHVLLSGSKRAVGRAGQFLGEAVVISTADLHAAALARADALEAALKRTEANRDAAMEDAAEEYARAERAEAALAEAVEALRGLRNIVEGATHA